MRRMRAGDTTVAYIAMVWSFNENAKRTMDSGYSSGHYPKGGRREDHGDREMIVLRTAWKYADWQWTMLWIDVDGYQERRNSETLYEIR